MGKRGPEQQAIAEALARNIRKQAVGTETVAVRGSDVLVMARGMGLRVPRETREHLLGLYEERPIELSSYHYRDVDGERMRSLTRELVRMAESSRPRTMNPNYIGEENQDEMIKTT